MWALKVCTIMYQVVLTWDGIPHVFAELKTDVEAVQLALALHQSSNQPHNVSVYFRSKEEDKKLVELWVV